MAFRDQSHQLLRVEVSGEGILQGFKMIKIVFC